MGSQLRILLDGGSLIWIYSFEYFLYHYAIITYALINYILMLLIVLEKPLYYGLSKISLVCILQIKIYF